MERLEAPSGEMQMALEKPPAWQLTASLAEMRSESSQVSSLPAQGSLTRLASLM